jgi:hypothetical protein
MIMTIDGQPVGYAEKYVRSSDIPSDINKAYDYKLDEEGGIGGKLGRAFDPVSITREETLTQDELPKGASNFKPFVALGIGVAILFVLLKVKL